MRCEHPDSVTLSSVVLPSGKPVDIMTDDCVARRVLPNTHQTVHQVRSGRSVGVQAELWNKEGRRFDNSSTALLAWRHDLDTSFLAFRDDLYDDFLMYTHRKVCQLGYKAAIVTIDTNVTGYATFEVFAQPLPQAPPLAVPVFERLLLELVHNHNVCSWWPILMSEC